MRSGCGFGLRCSGAIISVVVSYASSAVTCVVQGAANSHVWNLRRRCFDLRVEEAGWRGGVVARGPTAARLLLFLALPEQAHSHTTPARRLRLGDSVSSTDASAACHVGFEGCSQQRGIRCAWGSGVGLRLPPQQRALGPKSGPMQRYARAGTAVRRGLQLGK